MKNKAKQQQPADDKRVELNQCQRALEGSTHPTRGRPHTGSNINLTRVSEHVRDSPTEAAASASHHLHPPLRPPPPPYHHLPFSKIQTPPSDKWDRGRLTTEREREREKQLFENRPTKDLLLVIAKKLLGLPVLPRDGHRCMKWNRVLIREKINTVRINQKSLINFYPISEELRSLPSSGFCHVSLMSGSSGLVADVEF